MLNTVYTTTPRLEVIQATEVRLTLTPEEYDLLQHLRDRQQMTHADVRDWYKARVEAAVVEPATPSGAEEGFHATSEPAESGTQEKNTSTQGVEVVPAEFQLLIKAEILLADHESGDVWYSLNPDCTLEQPDPEFEGSASVLTQSTQLRKQDISYEVAENEVNLLELLKDRWISEGALLNMSGLNDLDFYISLEACKRKKLIIVDGRGQLTSNAAFSILRNKTNKHQHRAVLLQDHHLI